MEGEYRVVIQVPGNRRLAEHRITYQVTRLRPGVHQWSLVSDEDRPNPSGPPRVEHLQPSAHK